MSDTPTPPTADDVLPNPRYERFAQIMALGTHSAGAAYAECYPDASPDSAETLGPKLFRNLQIRERVAAIQRMDAKRTAMTVEEWRQWHEDAMRTPLSQIDEDHPLCQEAVYEVKGGQRGRLRRGDADEGNEEESPPVTVVKVKMVSKLDASRELAKHHGWTKERVETKTTVSGLAELLESLSRPGLPQEPAPEAPKAPAGLPTEPATEDLTTPPP